MTFVGKILVIAIMAFSLLFLAFTTVAFVTGTNWKLETSKVKEVLNKKQSEVSNLTAEVTKQKTEIDAAKKTHETEVKDFDNKIAQLNNDIAQIQQQATEAKGSLEAAQQAAKLALDEANARTKEVDLLRAQNEAVRKQSDEFKLSKTALEDARRELERQLEVAKKLNENLRDRVSTLAAFLRSKGLTDNINQVKAEIQGAVAPPPDVEGVITRIDAQSKRVEISIGSDDGLIIGHELNIFRTKPSTDYLGKIRIISVEPNQAVGTLVNGKTYQGKKLEEGDIVASTIHPRG
ncbi:hypothetical protein EP7_004620 [Isosphaeraceae bacterium EP7]